MSTITYAPSIPPVTGNRKLVCTSLKWQDNPGTNTSSVSNSCRATANNFKTLSGGKLIFNPVTYSIPVPYTHSGANVGRAVRHAIDVLKAKGINQDGNVTYVMVNNGAGGVSHSGGYVSNLLNALTTTFYHEVGRDIPTELGGSGAWQDNKYVWQADGTSFMSHFSSGMLTASQLYYLGWLPQVALHSDVNSTQDYTIDTLSPTSLSNNNLKAVLIPNCGPPLFLSRPVFKDGNYNALHQAIGGKLKDSARLMVFSNQATYNGLNFQQIAQSGDSVTLRISPVPGKTPCTLLEPTADQGTRRGPHPKIQ